MSLEARDSDQGGSFRVTVGDVEKLYSVLKGNLSPDAIAKNPMGGLGFGIESVPLALESFPKGVFSRIGTYVVLTSPLRDGFKIRTMADLNPTTDPFTSPGEESEFGKQVQMRHQKSDQYPPVHALILEEEGAEGRMDIVTLPFYNEEDKANNEAESERFWEEAWEGWGKKYYEEAKAGHSEEDWRRIEENSRKQKEDEMRAWEARNEDPMWSFLQQSGGHSLSIVSTQIWRPKRIADGLRLSTKEELAKDLKRHAELVEESIAIFSKLRGLPQQGSLDLNPLKALYL